MVKPELGLSQMKIEGALASDPRPLLPRTLLAPKYDTYTSILPEKGDSLSHCLAILFRRGDLSP